MSVSYADFLAAKSPRSVKRGLSTMPAISQRLFPFQRHCVQFLLECGAGGAFLDTGLGKTLVQLEYLEHARNTGNGYGLILAPLAVVKQIFREGAKFGYPVRAIRDQSEAAPGINICNYDRLHLLNPQAFCAVTLDEAGILKSFSGKTTRTLIDAFADHRWKVPATATPAPNDHMELGQHSEFCGIMNSNEMLSRFFINDTANASQSWRLKRHGVEAFWDWMASWCRFAMLPSDLGGDDAGFILPGLHIHRHRAAESAPVLGDLFGDAIVSATNLHQIKRETAQRRARIAVDLAMSQTGEPWVMWCDTDYEADEILAAIGDAPGVVEVRGSMKADSKEAALDAFSIGDARVLVTKPSVAGFGMNWQHCANTVFVGRSFSYETWYQAVRRFWRFGQQREVNVHLVVAEGEDSIARVIDRKAGSHAEMKAEMRGAMRRNDSRESARKVAYRPTHKGHLPSWIA